MGFYVAAQVVKLMAQKGIAGSRILVTAHEQFKAMGAAALRALDKPQHVLYDLKYALPAGDSDLSL